MKNAKKIFGVMLAASLILSFGSLTANAGSGGSFNPDEYEPARPEPINTDELEKAELEFLYEDNGDGTIAITGVTDDSRKNYNNMNLVEIPDTIDGKTVTKITRLGLEGGVIMLPSTLKEIGDGAFWWSTLYDNKLPEGLEKIGASVGISGAANAEKLVMPSTLKYIGRRAFSGTGGYVILNEGLEYIGQGAFMYEEEVFGKPDYVADEITIPSTVKYIGWDAFSSGAPYDWAEDNPRYKEPDAFQQITTFKVYGGGYVEQYMKSYVPHHVDGKPAGYKYTVIGQTDTEPTQTENVNGLSVSGAIPEGAELKAAATTTKWLENPLFCYEITLNKDGAAVQPDGYITISIPCEYSNGYVVYINEETGEMENLNSIYVDGKYVFVSDHLSEYAVRFDSEPKKAEYTNSSDNTTGENTGSGTNSTTGNNTAGNNDTGSETDTTNTSSNQTSGNQTTGSQTTGSQTTNNQTTGNNHSVPSTGDNTSAAAIVLTAFTAAAVIFAASKKRR